MQSQKLFFIFASASINVISTNRNIADVPIYVQSHFDHLDVVNTCELWVKAVCPCVAYTLPTTCWPEPDVDIRTMAITRLTNSDREAISPICGQTLILRLGKYRSNWATGTKTVTQYNWSLKTFANLHCAPAPISFIANRQSPIANAYPLCLPVYTPSYNVRISTDPNISISCVHECESIWSGTRSWDMLTLDVHISLITCSELWPNVLP